MGRGARSAIVAGVIWLVAAIFAAPAPALAAQAPPGPPFPPPEEDRAVYDHAGVFGAATISRVEATIDAIEARTGAEVVVYTQVKPGSDVASTEADAIALIDQWGIGRKGFDDGLAIFFNFEANRQNGQVQLYAGPGYRAAFLSNQDRQRIFEEHMLPHLRARDFDTALLFAMERIDANATPEHAARLQAARQFDAVVGLVGAPTLFLLLAGWGLRSWYRYGRDPEYLDSPSIHMAGPPAELTAASAALVQDGRSTRRALTTALLDLASRGRLVFREEESGLLGMSRKVGVEVDPPTVDPVTDARRALNSRRPLSDAETFVQARLRRLADESGGYVGPDELLKLGSDVGDFDRILEDHVTSKGWLAEAPRKVVRRWSSRGWAALAAGIVVAAVGFNLPSQGILLLGAAAVAGGVVLVVLSGSMPAVTVAGAMVRAMLAAYRRTLTKTMAQARSMEQVVAESDLGWLETPDQAVVWGTALGLNEEIERVLERSIEDVRAGRVESAYTPTWYTAGSASEGGGGRGGGGGLFSSSAVPSLGGMLAAIGSIGNSPSSSGSDGGGGGFGGGGSGGGGGGAGGGF